MPTTYLTKHERLHRLAERFDWRCTYCGRDVHCHTCDNTKRQAWRATRDHMIPRPHGGAGLRGNVVLSCWACNHNKGDRLPWECAS